jgi:hypothetical protein
MENKDEVIKQEIIGDKKKKTNYMPLIMIGMLIVGLAFMVIIFIAGKSYGEKTITGENSSFVSNLTNATLLKGFDAGFNYCKADVVKSINYTISKCVPLIVNVTGQQEYLVPLSCLNTTK